MSFEITSSYQLRRERQQEIAAARVAATTASYLANFQRMLAEFEQQDFDKYIPSEMTRLRNALAQAQMEQLRSPFEARNISMTIQNFIYNMRPMAREIKRQQDEAERERLRREEEERKAQKTETLNAFYEGIKQIKDAAVQNAARPDLAPLRSKIVSGSIHSTAQVKTAMDSIVKQAQQKAEILKQQAQEKAQQEGMMVQIAQAREQLQQENINSKVKEEQLKTLDEILNRVQDSTIEEVQKNLQTVNDALLKQKISEDELLETASYVCETLRAQGYGIPEDGVAMEEINGEKRIHVYGLRSSNDDAYCEISDRNELHFATKNQEFTMCLKDKENFGNYLQQAYSIDLSDERVLWENPDRISKGEMELPDTARRNA